jgi:hypothetical protein
MNVKPGSKRTELSAGKGGALAPAFPPDQVRGFGGRAINPSKPILGEDGWLFDIVNRKGNAPHQRAATTAAYPGLRPMIAARHRAATTMISTL